METGGMDTGSVEDVAEAFNRAVALVQRLKAENVSGADFEAAVATLKQMKSQYKKLTFAAKRRRVVTNGQPDGGSGGGCGSEHRMAVHYPARVASLPLEHNSDFVLSFQVGDPAAMQFYRKYGFVVFGSVLTPAECAATRGEVYEQLEAANAGFQRDQPETWDALSSKTYGLPKEQAVFSAQMVANRQNEKVVAGFRQLLGCEDVLVSHDRWCAYRPAADRPEWQTVCNLHLDVHPWSYVAGDTKAEELQYAEVVDFRTETNSVTRETGPHLQGVLNLLDNRDEDGGTQLVPGFHSAFDAWQAALGPIEDSLVEGGTTGWVVRRQSRRRRQGGGSFKFNPADPIHALSHRVAMREGSLLVWNQEVVHGSRPNCSDRWRVAQFIKAFRTESLSRARAVRRAGFVRTLLSEAGVLDVVTPTGRRVFGLEDADAGGSSTGGTSDVGSTPVHAEAA